MIDCPKGRQFSSVSLRCCVNRCLLDKADLLADEFNLLIFALVVFDFLLLKVVAASVAYVHAGGKIGVLVNLAVEGGVDATEIGKNVAKVGLRLSN